MGLGNQRRNDTRPEHEKVQKRSRKLQSLGDKLAQRRKTRASCPKGMNRPGLRSRNCKRINGGRNGQKIKAETLNDPELDLEIRALREGEGRRGSNASQSNGCCFDSAMWNSSSRWEQSGQSSSLQCLNVKTTGLTCSISPSDASTPSAQRAVGKGATSHDRSRRRLGRGAEKVSRTVLWGPSAMGGRNRGFPAGAVSDSTLLTHGTGGDGGEFDSPRGGTQRQTVSSKRRPLT